MTTSSSYYDRPSWDVDAWVDVISVEYESLIRAYPFAEVLGSLSAGEAARLLDLGCGTGIFPTYVDPVLQQGTRIVADLLDVSPTSIEQAHRTLAGLEHFEVGGMFESRIEDIPILLEPGDEYDIIWAIHSFTTVELSRMSDVYERLVEALSEEGVLLVYQLTAHSSYQPIHDFYLTNHPGGSGKRRYMEFEDSERLLAGLGIGHTTYELRFDHVVPEEPDPLSRYLAKVVLDDSVDASFFSPILDRFRQEGTFVFPQSVNLIEVHR